MVPELRETCVLEALKIETAFVSLELAFVVHTRLLCLWYLNTSWSLSREETLPILIIDVP